MRKENWKGMTAKQLADISAQQTQQCKEKREEGQRQKTLMASEARQAIAIHRTATAAAHRAETLRREAAKDIAATLQAQMRDKLDRDAARDACYTNHVTSHFFTQFQQSHR